MVGCKEDLFELVFRFEERIGGTEFFLFFYFYISCYFIFICSIIFNLFFIEIYFFSSCCRMRY